MVVMNHSYDVDWLAGWLVCERCALLAATKVFAKRSLSYVPVIGWIWRMAEIIFLDRNWQKDKACIVNQIEQISQYANPVWILLFPEGTRFTEAKHQASVEFARKGGLPHLKHLLTPRTKGFTLTMLAIKESGYKVNLPLWKAACLKFRHFFISDVFENFTSEAINGEKRRGRMKTSKTNVWEVAVV